MKIVVHIVPYISLYDSKKKIVFMLKKVKTTCLSQDDSIMSSIVISRRCEQASFKMSNNKEFHGFCSI